MTYEERMKWFHQARFGMFIHCGLYSILARGEWVMHLERIPADEYAELAKQFNPRKLDANKWMSLANEAGMKYAIFTARHHDGYCLYDSKVSDFTSVKTAAKRDFVAEYVQAAREAGLKVGLYYSLLDWRLPGWRDPEAHPESAEAMVEQAHAQVRELLTNYGKIDLLWYDGGWVNGIPRGEEQVEFWRAQELNAMARKLQPTIILNDRTGLPEDIDTPEQRVTASDAGRGWESCMTMGDRFGWGYTHNNPNFKTVTQLIQYLVMAASGEGNFLLNIGVKPDGTVRREETDRLRALGEWLEINGEAVYGSQRCAFTNWMIGVSTAKGNNAYICVFRWPKQGEIVIPGIGNKVRSATILGTDVEGEVTTASNNRTIIKGLPRTPPNRHCTVVKLVLDGTPEGVSLAHSL